MSEPSVIHHTFRIERSYPVSLASTFRAWSEPAIKARWFAPAAGQEHQLDFRVGGAEITRGTAPDGTAMVFASHYHDIVEPERIIYTSTLSADGVLATVSATTILFAAAGQHTDLRLIEQATFLEGREKPEWREHGTGQWLDALGTELMSVAVR